MCFRVKSRAQTQTLYNTATLTAALRHSDTTIFFFKGGGALSKSQRSGKEPRMRAEIEEEVGGQRER